jgi:hypothetical protein
MSDSLRDRIAAVQQAHHLRMDYNHPGYGNCRCGFRTGFQEREGEDDFDLPWWELHAQHVADELLCEIVGITRRCERCRHSKPLTDFPPPHQLGGSMRPFCINCTAYTEWATS